MEKTVLVYLEQNESYLMLHRVKKEHDINKDKWIGVGGHLEKGETPEEALIRETKEETGLTLLDYQLRGILYFYIDDLVEISYLYTSNSFKGTLIDCNEGTLQWVNKRDLHSLNLWSGDYLFLDKLLHNDPYFELKLVYKKDKLIKYEFIK